MGVPVPKRWPRSNCCELDIKLALPSTGIHVMTPARSNGRRTGILPGPPKVDLVHWATLAWGAFGSSDSGSRRSESGHAAPSAMAAKVPTSDTRRVALGGRPAQAPTTALGPPLVVRYS